MTKRTSSWAWDSIFYHIYPLGLLGCPEKNDFNAPPVNRLENIHPWLNHIKDIGCNALYLGPVFESGSHGYDTVDYYLVDRRLGTEDTLKNLVAYAKSVGIRIILDGVFNHVGRGFWAFRDLLEYGADSRYKSWFAGFDMHNRSPYGDSFAYEGWNGHYNLVKLNLHHPDVRAHLFDAVKKWIQFFDIDGLRLDAADVMDFNFLKDLSTFCRCLRPDFWLVGEVIHGDYNCWANSEILDATTNYECYKGLYSSHNDVNYFEIAYAFNRQFGEGGIYRNLPLYAFVDNHDVHRVASILHKATHLYPLYVLLFTMPGVPSIYYGSEWGLPGIKGKRSDGPLRPALYLSDVKKNAPHPNLINAIQQLISIRHQRHALRQGDYQQLYVDHEQFAFSRNSKQDMAIVAVNAADCPVQLNLLVKLQEGRVFQDLLAPRNHYSVKQGHLSIEVPPCWACILA